VRSIKETISQAAAAIKGKAVFFKPDISAILVKAKQKGPPERRPLFNQL